MRQFIARHADKISGVLSGFDRLIFRGHLLPLCHEGGVRAFLASQGVLLKDFGRFVETVTGMIRDGATEVVERLGRQSRYLESSRVSKEEVARQALAEQPIRADNCFPHLADPDRAQRIFDGMLALPWQSILDDLVARANPALAAVIDAARVSYYWTLHQSEWATDLMFRDASVLASCYPGLVRHAMTDFQSKDVMRFLGRRLTPAYQGEVQSDFKDRREGIRVKHLVGINSLKMYDKAHPVPPIRGAVPAALRIESTVNKPSDFTVRRKAQGKPKSPSKPRPLRKGIADIRRRARICQNANSRYADALAAATDHSKVHDVIAPVIKPAMLDGRRVRALRPWATPDLPLLRAISRGEFLLNGFRNRDILPLLFPDATSDPSERRKASARITYLLRILRGHGLVTKVDGTHRYIVNTKARTLIAAVLATDEARISRLKQCA